MNVILWVVMGALAGWIASMLMGTNERQGLLMDVIVGIVGAVAGGFLVSFLGLPGVTGFNLWSLLVAIGGAAILIAIVRSFRTGSV